MPCGSDCKPKNVSGSFLKALAIAGQGGRRVVGVEDRRVVECLLLPGAAHIRLTSA